MNFPLNRRERILSIDIGFTGIRIAEFESKSNSSLVLHAFDYQEYPAPATDIDQASVKATLEAMLKQGDFHSRKAAICLSGQVVFKRFDTISPLERKQRIQQVIEDKVKKNIPFAFDEVVWDYQLIDSDKNSYVLFAVVKESIINNLIDFFNPLSIMPASIEAASVALYNAARSNHIGDQEVSILLHVGGMGSNIIFVDKNNFFGRSIPVGGVSITKQIAKELDISINEAEVLKRRHGFININNVHDLSTYSKTVVTIAKIIRNAMNRIHSELNRSISVYRIQQKGKPPTQIYLSGAGATIPFTDRFFAEKCDMPVYYFNPFQNIILVPGLDMLKLEKCAHSFAKIVGTVIPLSSSKCPANISLLPSSLKREIWFRSKRGGVIGVAVLSVLLMSILVWTTKSSYDEYSREKGKFNKYLGELKELDDKLKKYEKNIRETRNEFETFQVLIQDHLRLKKILNVIQEAKPQDFWLSSIKFHSEDPTINLASDKSGKKARSNDRNKFKPIQWAVIEGYSVNVPGEKIYSTDTELVTTLQTDKVDVYLNRLRQHPLVSAGLQSIDRRQIYESRQIKSAKDPIAQNLRSFIILVKVNLLPDVK